MRMIKISFSQRETEYNVIQLTLFMENTFHHSQLEFKISFLWEIDQAEFVSIRSMNQISC